MWHNVYFVGLFQPFWPNYAKLIMHNYIIYAWKPCPYDPVILATIPTKFHEDPMKQSEFMWFCKIRGSAQNAFLLKKGLFLAKIFFFFKKLFSFILFDFHTKFELYSIYGSRDIAISRISRIERSDWPRGFSANISRKKIFLNMRFSLKVSYH